MTISRFPESQAALASAFQTIANHCGATPLVLDKLSSLAGALTGRTVGDLYNAPALAVTSGNSVAQFLAANATLEAASVFTLSTAQDTSATDFATAKGSAPAVGDEFAVNTAGNGVVYLGTTAAALAAALLPYTTRGYDLNKE